MRAAVTLLGASLLFVACGRTELTPWPGSASDGDASSRAGDVAQADVLSDAGPPDSDGAELEPALPIETPDRSAALDALYCELDNGHLVQSALRAAACLDIPLAGVLDDASRGFIFGSVLTDGYAPATFGHCGFLRCLSDASDCEGARRCDALRRNAPCEAFERRCDGPLLEACLWDGETYSGFYVQDCEAMGGECQTDACDTPDCRVSATCVVESMTEACDFYGRCDGDRLRRCAAPEAASGLAAEVVIDCAELVEGGTCRELAVGGEAPGPACVRAEAECDTHFASGFACSAEDALDLCLFGAIVTIDCGDYGYSGCEDTGFFGVRCVP